MSTFTGELHAVGYVAATQTALYSAPASTTSFIKRLYLNNKYDPGDMGATVETVSVYVRKNGGSVVRIRRIVLQPGYSHEIDHLVLDALDSLEAKTTNASTVGFIIDGSNET